jgi:hypothetical protein
LVAFKSGIFTNKKHTKTAKFFIVTANIYHKTTIFLTGVKIILRLGTAYRREKTLLYWAEATQIADPG